MEDLYWKKKFRYEWSNIMKYDSKCKETSKSLYQN